MKHQRLATLAETEHLAAVHAGDTDGPRRAELLTNEESDLEQEVRELFPDPDAWLNAPNDQLGGRKPNEIIGTIEEKMVRDLVHAIKYIGIS